MYAQRFHLAFVLLLPSVLCLALVPSRAAGQGRSRATLSNVGALRNLGQGSPTQSFRSFSYGLGSLNAGSGGRGGGVLRSSIGQTGFSVHRSGALSVSGSRGHSLGSSSLSGQLRNSGLSVPRSGLGGPTSGLDLRVGSPLRSIPIAPVAIGGSPPPGGAIPMGAFADHGRSTGIGDAPAEQDETALGSVRDLLRELEKAATSKLKNRSKPITSLVPTPASEYKDHMAKGDRAFRANNFHGAYTEFLIANDLGRALRSPIGSEQDPESLICLAHTQFSLSRYSYARAAYYLQLAIRHMPELPLANLRPRGFYGSANKYAEQMVALAEHLEKDPGDGEASLLLAYFRWFENPQDVPAARDALSKALTSAMQRKDSRLVDAIETFWRGMAETGKVSGKLPDASQPAAPETLGGPVPASPAGSR